VTRPLTRWTVPSGEYVDIHDVLDEMVDALAVIEAAAVARVLDVDRVAAALVAATPKRKHGQLCPVWTRRLESESDSPHSKKSRGGPIVCDCFISRDAPMKAAAILAALTEGGQG
jgi:hypothetical protein